MLFCVIFVIPLFSLVDSGKAKSHCLSNYISRDLWVFDALVYAVKFTSRHIRYPFSSTWWVWQCEITRLSNYISRHLWLLLVAMYALKVTSRYFSHPFFPHVLILARRNHTVYRNISLDISGFVVLNVQVFNLCLALTGIRFSSLVKSGKATSHSTVVLHRSVIQGFMWHVPFLSFRLTIADFFPLFWVWQGEITLIYRSPSLISFLLSVLWSVLKPSSCCCCHCPPCWVWQGELTLFYWTILLNVSRLEVSYLLLLN